MAISKYRVSVSFDLTTEIEPEGADSKIEDWIGEAGEDIEMSSYFGTQSVRCDGGGFSVTVEASDEDHAESLVRNVFDEGNEVEDYNGFTWLVEDVNFDVEALEWEPTVEEAIDVLRGYIEENLDKGSEEHEGRIAKAALVVLDDHARLSARVGSLEAQVSTILTRNAELAEQIRALTEQVARLTERLNQQG